jgi:hypothetical protein
MIFSWLKRRRRKRLTSAPLPDAWRRTLAANAHHYEQLPDELRRRLEDYVKVFVAEKWWEGARGLVVTEEMKVTIAGNACLLLVGTVDEFCFENVQTVLVYPEAFRRRPERHPPAGKLADLRPSIDEGLANQHGPVVLSWDDVLRGGRGEDDRGNVVLHEFAHKLDELSGEYSGTPLLPDAERREQWERVMSAEFRRLRDDARARRPTVLDDYGASDRIEFFAVATETFFEFPLDVREHHGALYELLSDFYRLDPAAWCDEEPNAASS